jgi:hypothetical protein
MTGLRSLLRLLLPLALAGIAAAQVEVRIQMESRNFVAGEPVPVTVSVTNHSGQDILFQGTKEYGWIDFNVTSNRGTPMPPLAKPAFGGMKVPLGQTMSRSFDLSRIYPLKEMGNYSVYAMVRLPGQSRDGFVSNRVLFNVDTARPYWSQKVGLPGKAGQTREYRVLDYNSGRKSMLYAQVVDARTGTPLQTHSLGEYLNFRKPSVTLDNRQVMHVLYLKAPTIWAHARVSPDGSLLGAELHKNGAGDPVLMTSADGIVQVGNSIPYDPKAEAEARAKVKKASDRPSFLFQ